eukprot:gene2850-5605_t
MNAEKEKLIPHLSPTVRARLRDMETGRSTIPAKTSKIRSLSTIDTYEEETAKQDKIGKQRSRFYTVDADMTPSALNPIKRGRRELYGSLPFVSAFGMGHREHVLNRAITEAARFAVENSELEQVKCLVDVDIDEILITVPMALAVLVAMASQFLVGFNTSVMNAPAHVVFPNHTTIQWSFAVSSFAIGGAIGASIGGTLASSNGRRGTLMINIWIFFFGGMIMALAPSIYWIIPARFIIGIAAGISSVVVPVYLGEIAPPTLRGTLGTCTQFATVIGILISDVIAIPLCKTVLWRYLFAVTPILCVLQLFVSSFLLESPRWLLARDENSERARINIKKLRGFRLDEEVENEVENFLFAAKKHQTTYRSAHSGSAVVGLFHTAHMRPLLISVMILQAVQQLCGINAIFYYSTTFFEKFVSYPIEGTILVAFINVIATYIALKLMDTTARRTLLLWSCIAVMSFVAFFEIGLGPIPWLIVAEMFDMKYVATAMSISCIVNWICMFFVGLCFPFMDEYLGPWSFVPFGIILFFGLIYTYLYLPETHERFVSDTVITIFLVNENSLWSATFFPTRNMFSTLSFIFILRANTKGKTKLPF